MLRHPRLKTIDFIAAIWLAVCNAAAFLAVGFDKWRASRSSWRVPEATLVILGALGGWPGGFVSMVLFRHKTAKWPFKLKYAFALLPFAGELWLWQHWR